MERTVFLWSLFIFASISLATTLTLQYVGEEAVYTISSLEMHYYHEMFRPMLYGTFYQRPPMVNWLMMAIASGIGWENILIAARLLNTCATIFTALLLIFFTQHLSHNRSFAIFAGLCYFSFDILFRRGWLAYADSVFAFFVFAAIVCLWVALNKKNIFLFIVAMLSLAAAFLSKALTAYVFYGVSLLVLFIRHPNGRAVLLNPFVIILHIIGFSFPLIWNFYFAQGAHSTSMVADVLTKFQNWDNLSRYLIGLIAQPADILLRLSPATLIALYLLLRKRTQFSPELVTLFWIIGLNFLPYAISPIYSMRYILPLNPLIALAAAYIIWFAAREYFKFTIICCAILFVLKCIAGAWWFPYYERTYRGNYAEIAKDIIQRTQNYPLYPTSTIAIGLSVTASLDALRWPKQPLTFPPQQWESGFLITEKPMPEIGNVVKKYQLGREELYLLCKGKACL